MIRNKNLTIIFAIVIVAGIGVLSYFITKPEIDQAKTMVPAEKTKTTAPAGTKTSFGTSTKDKGAGQSIKISADKIVTSDAILHIDKLSLNLPIMLNIDGDNKEEYLSALESGVAHMNKTALPRESGNTVIFGHSSYYKDQPGDYKNAFSKINELVAGDRISITVRGATLLYEVEENKIVSPDDTQVVSQKNANKLTLITCWPVNSTESRMVIVAKKL